MALESYLSPAGIFDHNPIGHSEPRSLTLTFIKQPHFLQVEVGLNRWSQSWQIAKRSLGVFASMINQ
jgi:hypothetical protein